MKILLTLIILLSLSQKPALAVEPSLFLSPTSGSFSQAFNLQIKVNTATKAIGGVDVYLSYPKDLLRAEEFSKGTAFPEAYSLIKADEGKWRIFAYFPYTQAANSFTGSDGLIGTVKFTPLALGTAPVTFICNTGQTNETNIIEKSTTQDIVSCTANVAGSYQLTGGVGGPLSSPQPTPTATASATASASAAPVTGISLPTFSLLGLAIFALLTGLALGL